ncbi:hypothetical protein GOODEAATRI_011557 [Goodea atripinnis]|uniref:Uncharacterized protein n=1 Tax=Goodea atripinnis TaxID=208336 RepID=A0ABV0PX80_9TELE
MEQSCCSSATKGYLIRVTPSHLFLETFVTNPIEAQYYSNVTPPPDYESDYNATFEYSFFSESHSLKCVV